MTAVDRELDDAPVPARDDPGPALSLTDVTVRFGGITALENGSVSVEAGEVRGLIGPNGAGKTTLLDVISGVRAPDSGRVVPAGEGVTRRSSVYCARRGLRRTFQRSRRSAGSASRSSVATSPTRCSSSNTTSGS